MCCCLNIPEYNFAYIMVADIMVTTACDISVHRYARNANTFLCYIFKLNASAPAVVLVSLQATRPACQACVAKTSARNFQPVVHYIDVTWVLWCLKSLATRLFVQRRAEANLTTKTIAVLLAIWCEVEVAETIGDKGPIWQYDGKRFYLMASSCSTHDFSVRGKFY